MKSLKKFIFIALLIAFTSFTLQFTLAKYKDKITAPVTSNIARWNIKVNNETINNKSTLTSSITPTFDSNQYVQNNTLAPGSEGYFDIIIDATNTDVSFDYNIEITQDEENEITDFKCTGYKINDGEVISSSGNITGTIIHNTSSTTIRIYITWDDSTNSSLSNQEDTEIAINNTNAVMKANITFNQKK